MSILIKADLWLGIIVSGVGLWAYLQSRGFDEYSGTYPQFLSFLHILIGVGLILKALRKTADEANSIRQLFEEVRGPLVVALLLVGWGLLLQFEVGYLFSSVLVMPLILYALGYRGTKRIIFGSVSIVFVIFLLFYVIFDVPLPLHNAVEQLFG